MKRHISPLLGLFFLHVCLGQSASSDTDFGSGSVVRITDTESGSGSVWSSTVKSNSVLDGSGSMHEATSSKPNSNPSSNTIFLPDDEDTPIETGSGREKLQSVDTIDIGSGTVPFDVTTSLSMITVPDMSKQGIHCIDFYCWCIDANLQQVLGTRRFFRKGVKEEGRNNIVSAMRCLEQSTAAPFSQSSTSTSTEAPRPSNKEIVVIDKDIIVEEHIERVTPRVVEVKSERPLITARTPPPYIVDRGDNVDKDQTPKQDKPAEAQDPDRGWEKSKTNGLTGADNVHREPAPSALFTHPGILAAIIGGGVVALLSALLLIMFIVYRMRKKDEGSYPLDGDSKPPRLHTYTRAPNKEFYA